MSRRNFRKHRVVHYLPEQRTGKYLARLIATTHQRETDLIHRLRYDYFVCERGWVPKDHNRPSLESDHYDHYCCHLAVFDESEKVSGERALVGYLRALPWRDGIGFMLEHDFSCLLPQGHKVKRTNSVELSRLVIAQHLKERGPTATRPVVELLLKLLYRLSLQENWSTYYIVVEETWLVAFRRRYCLPFSPIGETRTFPDGTRTLAAVAHRQEMEDSIKSHDYAKYEWYIVQNKE